MTPTMMQQHVRRRRRGAAPTPPAAVLCALLLLLMLAGCGTLGKGRTAGDGGGGKAQPVDAAVLIPKCQAIVRETYAGQPVTYGPPSTAVTGETASVTVPFMLPRADGSYGDGYAKYTCRFTGTALTGSGLAP
jgi:hypothetical protein